MNKRGQVKPKLFALLLLCLLLQACDPVSERHEMTIWYVATTGSDSNVCTEVTYPCRTFAEVFDRADEDDKIILAAGIYNEVGTDTRFTGGTFTVEASKASLWVTGAGMGETIIDVTGSGSIQINGPGSYQLDNFTIRNGEGICIGVGGEGQTVTIENVEATGCGSGFSAGGRDTVVTLINAIASWSVGVGAYTYRTETIIQGGEFSDNGGAGIEAAGSTGSLTVDGAIIQRNASNGVLVNGGTVTLINVEISGNGTPGGPIDPAVRSDGGAAVSITDSLIHDNRQGPGVFFDSSLLIATTTIRDNSYDGVFIWGGQAQLQNVSVINNCSQPEFTAGVGTPCGIQSYSDGTVVIRNSYIHQNQTGGIYNGARGEMSIYRTMIDENNGSSCTVDNSRDAVMVITNSLIANNTPYGTGPVTGVCNSTTGDLSIENSTISNNGNGVRTNGQLALSYVTIAENDSSGLLVYGSDLIPRIDNTLIVKNGFLDCISSSDTSIFRIGGTNFDSDGSCPDPFITHSPADILLDALAANGGLTLTHALLPGSPAIDAASGSCPAGDQRTVPRPVGLACDVGAYEAGAVTTGLEATPTSSEIIALVLEDARCRTGPGQVYPDFDFFQPGQTTITKGRSADSNWYYVEAVSYAGNCWIGQAVLQFDVSADVLLALPIINPPPTPTPTLDPDESYDPSPTPKPTACPTLINKPGSCK